MHVLSECDCGRRFQTAKAHVGKAATCPECGNSITIGQRRRPVPAQPKKPRSIAVASQDPGVFLRFLQDGCDESGATPPQPATPTGSHSQSESRPSVPFPLNNAELDELKQAEIYRRRIRIAAIVYRIEYIILMVTAVPALLVSTILMLASSRSVNPQLVVFFVSQCLNCVFAVLLYMSHREAMKCKAWPLVCMLIIHTLQALGCMTWGFILSLPENDFTPIGVFFVLSLVPAVVAIISYRGWSAIPLFRSQPVWTQQTLLYCEL